MEEGIVEKSDGTIYEWQTSIEYRQHRCQQWEDWEPPALPKPVPILEIENDFDSMKHKITCTHCSTLLVDASLTEVAQ